jgi:hypothetical protein
LATFTPLKPMVMMSSALAVTIASRIRDLEIGLVRPGVERFVADQRVEVGLFAAIARLVEIAGVARLAILGTCVGAAGDRALHADADLVAFLRHDRDDVDPRQEVARPLQLGA